MKRYPMDLFEAQVSSVQRLCRDFVRVSLAAPSLCGLAAPAGDGAGPVLDAYLKLLIPHPDLTGPVRFELSDTWRNEWFSASPEERGGWMRTYTLRAARPWTSSEGEAGVEIDIDFVLHGVDDPHGMGPGAAWAASAAVGDPLSFIGPSREGQLWTTWDPGHARCFVVCADETAIPAAAAVMDALSEDTSATFLLELPEGNGELRETLPARVLEREDVDIQWLPRGVDDMRGEPTLKALRNALGLAAQSDADDAATLASEVVGPEEIVWGRSEQPEETYVYLAGEASVVRTARRVCVQEAGIDKKNISFMGYWKAGQAES